MNWKTIGPFTLDEAIAGGVLYTRIIGTRVEGGQSKNIEELVFLPGRVVEKLGHIPQPEIANVIVQQMRWAKEDSLL